MPSHHSAKRDGVVEQLPHLLGRRGGGDGVTELRHGAPSARASHALELARPARRARSRAVRSRRTRRACGRRAPRSVMRRQPAADSDRRRWASASSPRAAATRPCTRVRRATRVSGKSAGPTGSSAVARISASASSQRCSAASASARARRANGRLIGASPSRARARRSAARSCSPRASATSPLSQAVETRVLGAAEAVGQLLGVSRRVTGGVEAAGAQVQVGARRPGQQLERERADAVDGLQGAVDEVLGPGVLADGHGRRRGVDPDAGREVGTTGPHGVDTGLDRRAVGLAKLAAADERRAGGRG